MRTDFDVLVVGSGCAGSILACVLARRGLRVALVEKGTHPRFALGESSTPLAALALERLAQRFDLAEIGQLATYGAWKRHHSELTCGLKRGFSFFHHALHQQYANHPGNDRRLLFAASPDDAISDLHWLRSDVDAYLVELAASLGVHYFDELELDSVDESTDPMEVVGFRHGRRIRWTTEYIIDSSGPNGLLARQLNIAPRAAVQQPNFLPQTELVFAHFEDVRTLREVSPDASWSDGPYADEDAAVHHLTADGWLYTLRFDNGITSAGFVLQHGSQTPRSDLDPQQLWQLSLQRYPSLQEMFADARPVRAIARVPHLQHRLSRAAGRRWALLPHSYCFVGPLFSTGLAWSLLAVERLADRLVGADKELASYGALLEREADQLERLIGAAHLTLSDPERFRAIAFLYFATVSFEEIQQRLFAHRMQQPPWWRGFLGAGDPEQESLFVQLIEELHTSERPPAELCSSVLARLRQRDVIGLSNSRYENLYPVDLECLVERAGLFGVTAGEMRQALPRLRSSLAAPGSASA